MAIVKIYTIKLSGTAPDARWSGADDGSFHTTSDENSCPAIDFRIPSDATDIGVRIENCCNKPIRVRIRAQNHERHGLIFEIEPGRANTEFWDMRSMPVGTLEWSIDGEYPTLVDPSSSTGPGDTAYFGGKHLKIHDPTFKVTKGG